MATVYRRVCCLMESQAVDWESSSTFGLSQSLICVPLLLLCPFSFSLDVSNVSHVHVTVVCHVSIKISAGFLPAVAP
jgi:hypothetical protein